MRLHWATTATATAQLHRMTSGAWPRRCHARRRCSSHGCGIVRLLGNAAKFTNSGGISVRGKLVSTGEPTSLVQSVLHTATQTARSPRPDGLWIALQVADSGVGISDKDCERIFDEFEQVNAGPRGDSIRRGTGLGLSISRRLARLLGGDITVESELARGSVFTVWLPVNPADLRGDRAA